MLISSLLSGREEPRIILIKDDTDQCGDTLLACFTSALVPRIERLRVISSDQQKAEIWRNLCSTSKLAEIEELRSRDDVTRLLHSSVNDIGAVVIDDLSCLCVYLSDTQITRCLHRFSKHCKQLVLLAHVDCMTSHTLTSLSQLADCVISVSRSGQNRHKAHVVLRRISGKVVKEVQEFGFSKSYSLTDVVTVDQFSIKQTDQQETSDPSAAALTFNLRLTEDEKSSRSRVKLPYHIPIHSQEQQLGGQIYYQPDDADDFDEEDPDDDLDI